MIPPLSITNVTLPGTTPKEVTSYNFLTLFSGSLNRIKATYDAQQMIYTNQPIENLHQLLQHLIP